MNEFDFQAYIDQALATWQTLPAWLTVGIVVSVILNLILFLSWLLTSKRSQETIALSRAYDQLVTVHQYALQTARAAQEDALSTLHSSCQNSLEVVERVVDSFNKDGE